MVNLADLRLGTEVLYATDDFFAEKENMLLPGRGVFIEGKYTDRGKWMDGWESRRKRTPGHDYATLRLGARGQIKGVDIDTNFFLGNHPPHASIDGWCAPVGSKAKADPAHDSPEWKEILPKVELKPGSQNLFEVSSLEKFTHVRLHIYPDGGVARFRVYGVVDFDWTTVPSGKIVDLAAVEHGGRVVTCNDSFFGPKDNLIMPNRGANMGDGWETKRRRTPGHDWVILGLGHQGKLHQIEVDTAHFKGNYPDRCSFEVAQTTDADILNGKPVEWMPLLGEQKLQADHQHYFDVKPEHAVTHVRMNIFPDGGVSRLRLRGEKA